MTYGSGAIPKNREVEFAGDVSTLGSIRSDASIEVVKKAASELFS